MIEVVGAVAKWLQLVANMIVLGTCVFFVVANYDKATFHYPLLDRLERALPWLAAAIAVFLLVELAAKTAEVTDVAANAWKPAEWLGVVKHTWLGKVWAARMAFVVVLFPLTLYVRNMPSARWRYLLCAAIAGAALAAGAFSGHAAAEELPMWAIGPYALHILLAGVLVWRAARAACGALRLGWVANQGRRGHSGDRPLLGDGVAGHDRDRDHRPSRCQPRNRHALRSTCIDRVRLVPDHQVAAALRDPSHRRLRSLCLVAVDRGRQSWSRPDGAPCAWA